MVYSAFGIVKLSRTSLCFLVFFSSLTTGVAASGGVIFDATGWAAGVFLITTFLAAVALSITALEGTVLDSIFLDAMDAMAAVTAVGLDLPDSFGGSAMTGLGALALTAGLRATTGFAAVMGAMVLARAVAGTWVGVTVVGIKTFKGACHRQAQAQAGQRTRHNKNDK